MLCFDRHAKCYCRAFWNSSGDTTQTTHSQPPCKQNVTAKAKETGLWHFARMCCVWAASRKPNANVRIVGVRPGSRESSSPCRNSLGYSSVLLNGFHFTTAIKDQYAGRYNDPISLLFAKDKVLNTGISPQKDNWDIFKCFLFQSMQLLTTAFRDAEQKRLQQRQRLHWK